MITNPQSIKRLGHFLTADNISAGTPNGGKDISGAKESPYPINMLATAWGLGIANPQSIKWLGHFLTADCKSAGTPNGGQGISGAKESAGTPNGGKDISGATSSTDYTSLYVHQRRTKDDKCAIVTY